MIRTPAEISFHSSGLIRTLSEFQLMRNGPADVEFAEKLSHWVNFRDAIELSALHSTPPAPKATSGGAHRSASPVNREAFDRDLSALQSSILQSCSLKAGTGRNTFPVPAPQATLEDGGAYPPYRLYHQDRQREIESGARKLRVLARKLAAGFSESHRSLAVLDARFENILGERETKLLARVPLLMEKHFLQLRQVHLDTLDASGQPDSPQHWLRPGGWLARYCQDLQNVLMFELELRLQPALGLLDALTPE